jgi:hypothetical protein
LGYHCFSLDRVEGEHEHLVGRRVALLALAKRKGFAIPPGFVVLAKTFGDLVRDTELKLLLPSLEKRLIARSLPMEAISAEIRKLIQGVKVPRHIMLDVEGECKTLGLGERTRNQAVTVRACVVDERLSSAPLERAVAVTRLSDVEARLKDCWASAFDPENLEAIRHHKIDFADAAPAILVSQTVGAETSGVLFSHAPADPGAMLIEAVWGFHEALGEGKFFPSRYVVDRATTSKVHAEETAQDWEYAQGPQGPLVRREVPADRKGRPKLSRLMVEELVRSGFELERLVGGPVGVEWSVQGGVVFVMQVVPIAAPVASRGEEEVAERHIQAVEAVEAVEGHRRAAEVADRAARAPAGLIEVSPPKPPAPAPKAPRDEAASPAPRPRPPPRRAAKLLPVIQSSLFVELPPGSTAKDALHIPHAGLVVAAPSWRQPGHSQEAFAAELARAATAVFPRPVLVELSDIDPGAYEALGEATEKGGQLSEGILERLLSPMMDEMRAVAAARSESGATNLHVVAPFVKSGEDSAVLRAAMRHCGLGDQTGPRTLAFWELRNPSTLLFNLDAAGEQDGIIVRADRFYKALVLEGAVRSDAPNVPSPSFVRALLDLTRAFERAGATVLVQIETDGDFNTIWFYRELGVDGFIARLEDAEACVHHLLEAERRKPYGPRRRGRGT